MVGLTNVDNTSDKLKALSDATIAQLALKSAKNAPTFTGIAAFSGGLSVTGGTATGITQVMVGLDKVTNTADKDKIVSDPTQTALNLLAPKASPIFTGTATFTDTYGLTKAMVGLSNADNTSDKLKVVSDAKDCIGFASSKSQSDLYWDSDLY